MVPHSKQIRKRVRLFFLLYRNFSRLAIGAEAPCVISSRNGEEEAILLSEETGVCARENRRSKLTHANDQEEGGQKRSVLALYEELSSLEIQAQSKPSIARLTGMLHKCRREKSLSLALRMHNLICDMGLEAHAHLGDPLVSMLAEVGSLHHAQYVFDMLECKSESSWNSLIIGLAKFGELGHACSQYEQMQKDSSLRAGSHTVVALLNSCGKIKDIERGCRLHADIARSGFLERDVYVGSTLVDMYAKCGLLYQAQEVFDTLPIRNTVSWNALIAGYVEHGHNDIALDIFEQMRHEGNTPSVVTFVCILKACVSIGALHKGQVVHIDLTRHGLENGMFIGSILVDMYAKSGSLVDAQKAFNNLLVRDMVSWTVLIAGYGEHNCAERAFDIFDQMRQDNVSPGAVTFVCILKACASARLTCAGRELHSEVVKKGLEQDPVIGSTLVEMYARGGSLGDAQVVFDKIMKRDVVLWTTLLAGYTDNGCFEESLKRFQQMREENICLEVGVIVCSLKACGSTEATLKGRKINSEVVKIGLESKLPIGNVLVDMYTKCGALKEAQDVFDRLPSRDVVSWTALLAGYAQSGESDKVFKTFDRMVQEHTMPNLVTFLSVLHACSHAGLVEKGQFYFQAMINHYFLTPTLEHYACLADLLGRTGLLDEAVTVISKMPVHPSIVVWLTVLAACRKWGNIDHGKHAFKEALCLNQKNSSVFLCMFNIYADAEMEGNADEIEALQDLL